MKMIPEKYANRPNLWRVACELSKSGNPDKVLDVLAVVLSGRKEDLV